MKSQGSSTGNTLQGTQSNRYITDRPVGSTPPPATRFRIKWADELKCRTGVYVRRWFIETPWFSIRLHHWLHSDDDRAMHDHTWWFITLVLAGSYYDITTNGQEEMSIGSLRFRPAHHSHVVKVNPSGCWTLLLTGPIIREFGFWTHNGWRKANRYFYDYGKHICE